MMEFLFILGCIYLLGWFIEKYEEFKEKKEQKLRSNQYIKVNNFKKKSAKNSNIDNVSESENNKINIIETNKKIVQPGYKVNNIYDSCIEKYLNERDICYLIHFTNIYNLESILRYGICDNKNLQANNIDYKINDTHRFDNNLNCVSLSIEYPNYKFLYNLKNKTNNKYCILVLDAKKVLLSTTNKKYFYPNNAASNFAKTFGRRSDLEALQSMFYKDICRKRICMNMPTDAQAEIMFQGIIPAKYILSIEFENIVTKCDCLAHFNDASLIQKYKDLFVVNDYYFTERKKACRKENLIIYNFKNDDKQEDIQSPLSMITNEPNGIVDFDSYVKKIQINIKNNWNPPKGTESGKVVLLFSIAKDGNLLDVTILESSENRSFDELAINAVKTTAPFTLLPEKFKGDCLSIQFTFDYRVGSDLSQSKGTQLKDKRKATDCKKTQNRKRKCNKTQKQVEKEIPNSVKKQQEAYIEYTIKREKYLKELTNTPNYIKQIPVEEVDDVLIFEFLKLNSSNITYLSDDLCNKCLVSAPKKLFRIISSNLDIKMVEKLVKINPISIKYIPKTLLNKEICLYAFSKNKYTAHYIPKKYCTLEMKTFLEEEKNKTDSDVHRYNQYSQNDVYYDIVENKNYQEIIEDDPFDMDLFDSEGHYIGF